MIIQKKQKNKKKIIGRFSTLFPVCGLMDLNSVRVSLEI
jgi:hypothetical protein